MKKKFLNNKAIKRIFEEDKKRELINTMLLEVSKSSSKELLSRMNTSSEGLEDNTVLEMREIYGDNRVSDKNKDTFIKRLCASFINPFTIVLFLLASISTFTDIILPDIADKNPTTVIIITIMVTMSGILRFIQETRSNNAAEKLNAMVNTTATIRRKNHGDIEISMDEIVYGDIVYLSAGDMIPADMRLIEAKDLFISQSVLTGESEPVEKVSSIITADKITPIECGNLVFMGSNVISGSAIGIVISTGDNTFLGLMSQEINDTKVITNFEKGVNSISWLLIRFMMVMVPIVFFINGITKGDWVSALLFSISIAVGLTPEMLPMIVTTSLAKGAVAMSKKKAIIKNLNSIQSFGAMDILCTDKTGTLTEDKIVLEYHLDVHGDEDERVLRHAFMNSYFQTGLKNLMDIAIINYARDKGYINEYSRYKKVDEIPFDFNRRRMSVVLKDDDGKTQLITKGAVEEIFSICDYVEYKGVVENITEDIKNEILDVVNKLNKQGMRVIAVAQKNNPSTINEFSVKDEANMVLMGYLAFLDPPKESANDAIKALKEYGVKVKVLTGDNENITRTICKEVGINEDNILLGVDIDNLNDKELSKKAEETSIFAKLTPSNKKRIVRILKENGHVVGFMGDGINDAAAMCEADVGISVDTAVDIAKESADIILLEKNLNVLKNGVIEGRKTFANMIKYIKMTASSNFGNMFSVLIASAFLPFLPMLSIQLIVLNLIYDLSCVSIPFDNVDEEYLKKPKKWDASSIGKFMFVIGPTSSVFDIVTYIVMYFIICPLVCGGRYFDLGVNQALFISVFNSGWFIQSLWSQTLVIHMIRSSKIPFIQSRASFIVSFVTSVAILIGTIIPFTGVGRILGMSPLPKIYFIALLLIILLYMILVTFIKKLYIKKYGELL